MHPVEAYGQPPWKYAAIENGKGIEQERKSLTAMLSCNVNKKQIDDYEKKCRVRTKHVDELF